MASSSTFEESKCWLICVFDGAIIKSGVPAAVGTADFSRAADLGSNIPT